MSNWYIIESHNRHGMDHIPCVVAICPEELLGRRRPNRTIGWKFYSKDTAYETREEAEKMVATIMAISKVRALPTVQSLTADSRPVEDSAWGVYRLKCGCTVSPKGRMTTCNFWRKAKGAMGFEERLFPKALYTSVRAHLGDLELQHQRLWHRIENGVAIEKDIPIIIRHLKKRIKLFIELGQTDRQEVAEALSANVLALKAPPTTFLYGPQMPAFVPL